MKSFSQATCTSCLGTGTPNGLYWCVTTATQLYEALVTGNGTAPPIQPGGTVDICGTINLGEINPVLQPFPWDIPAGVTLQGNYDYVTGTRILFPYLYKGGVVCAYQLRITPGGEVVEQTLPANEDDGIDMILAAPDRIAYVFSLSEGSQFNNICLQGPKTDLKEQFMYFKMLPLMDQHCAYYPELFNVKEGLSGGLFLNCANCSVNNSEVYGFSLYNVQAVPPASLTGMAEINNSYIHNSKLWGYGYGLFGSGGGGANCSIPLHPCTGPWGGIANINTKNAPPQTIKISKSIFTENGKDLDAAGNGYNFDVTENTMGLRVGAAIVNQHVANFGNSGLNAQTCNIAPNPLAPCLFYPAYGLDDCCNPVISHISGEWINFVNNYLLSGSGEFDLGYPNTWTPDDATCTFPSNTRASGINIENNWFLGETASIWNRIRICDTDHLYWMKEHFAPYGGPFNTALVPPNPTHNPPQYVPLNFYQLYTDIIAGMPQVKIGAKLPSIAHQNPTSVHSILAGDVIEFNTEQCLDASGNLSSANNMWFMWRLNKLSNNLDDETRTGHVSISAPLKVPFEEIGITSIDLIGVDKRDNKASYIATHKVTVRPADYNYHIVFHIKDSYDGPWLEIRATVRLQKKP
ncbi:MAG: hypothetical protein IPJ79_07370 [Bacteroidetes bacterium]|nr:hypothetical protein [Bacteroidota bacterium]